MVKSHSIWIHNPHLRANSMVHADGHPFFMVIYRLLPLYTRPHGQPHRLRHNEQSRPKYSPWHKSPSEAFSKLDQSFFSLTCQMVWVAKDMLHLTGPNPRQWHQLHGSPCGCLHRQWTFQVDFGQFQDQPWTIPVFWTMTCMISPQSWHFQLIYQFEPWNHIPDIINVNRWDIAIKGSKG